MEVITILLDLNSVGIMYCARKDRELGFTQLQMTYQDLDLG